MSLVQPTDPAWPSPGKTPAARFGRFLRFCLDQMSGMRISFGTGGHEKRLTLTFGFLSSLVAAVVLLTILWACGASWFANGERFDHFYAQLSVLGDGWFASTVRVIVSSLLTIGAWIVAVGQAIGASLLVFAATASVGAIVGFLFGVPRPLSESGPGAASAAAAAGGQSPPAPGNTAATGTASRSTAGMSPGWYANTNLTQVSDWLTKIIVGVGLVEASRIGDVAQRLNDYVKDMLFEAHYGASVILPAIMIIGLIVGFLYCYLFTQLFLATLMVQTAMALQDAVDLFQAQPAATFQIDAIPAASFIVAPPIKDPRSPAPVRTDPVPSAEQIKAAAQIQAVPLADIDDPASLKVWARACAVLDDYDAAIAGYTKLLTKERGPDILVEAARVYSSAHDFGNARRLTMEAYARRQTADQATKERIAFDAAYLALYEAAPGGYRRALQILDDPTLRPLDTNGGLHVLRACALGQRFGFEDASLSDDEKRNVRRRALDDLKFAIDSSKDNERWIIYLLGRQDDGKPRPAPKPGETADDDLFPFKDDPEFLALVGLAPAAPKPGAS